MPTQQVSFEGAHGHTLAARLETPPGTPKAYALFAHCFSCGKDSMAAVKVSRALAARSIATLRFDFTGLGASGGEFADTTFSTNLDDVVAAADYLRRQHAAPALLIGHSLGGAAVIAAADRIGEARALVTIGAPSDIAHVTHTFSTAVPEIEAQGESVVTLGARKLTLRRAFLDDLREHPQLERIAKLRRALLIMHAPTDAVVGIENASVIFLAAKHPKSFVSLDDADHFLTRVKDADYAAALIAAWAARYLPEATRVAESEVDGAVVVEETGEGRFQNDVRVGAHSFLTDEPQSVGGDDAGPTPYDLLSAGLGACKSMTMRLYAERKGLKLDRIKVIVSHGRVHAADCSDCETTTSQIDEFRVAISLEGDLDQAQKTRILEIADRCPVHRTLHGEVKIRTTSFAPPAPQGGV